ncbi:MAG: hypothetical protein ACREMD_16155 [Gemmatimonadota bacterium]
MKVAALQWAPLLVLLVACDSLSREGRGERDPTGPPEFLQIGGLYRVTQTNDVPNCSAPLPPPPLPDEDPNDFVEVGPFTIEARVEIRQDGPRIDWIVLEVDGRPASEVALLGAPLFGRLDEEDNLTFTDQSEFREATREDSLNYHVTWALDATSHFTDRGGVLEFEGTGVSTYTFRTSPSGPVSTTCTVSTTSSGMRAQGPMTE